jgi:hypothetical protein
MANQNSGPYFLTDYGLTNALQNVFPSPIVAKRAPTVNDTKYQLGQIWLVPSVPSSYILISVISNVATWLLLATGAGAGVFASLTVTPGPISLTGTTTINTAGAATTTIGTGGTGAVAIGNATGNTIITGTLGVTGVTSVNTGTAVTPGGAIAMNIGGGATAPQILAGSGAPTIIATQGSLYLRTDGSSGVTRAYINTTGSTVWTAIDTVA